MRKASLKGIIRIEESWSIPTATKHRRSVLLAAPGLQGIGFTSR